jgi:hypothetical protein
MRMRAGPGGGGGQAAIREALPVGMLRSAGLLEEARRQVAAGLERYRAYFLGRKVPGPLRLWGTAAHTSPVGVLGRG